MNKNFEKFLRPVETLCATQGKRLTPPRRTVLAILHQRGIPLTAYEILALFPEGNAMSVYRALDFLTEVGIVHRIESLNAYALCVENHCLHRDSQYMVCASCGRTTEIHDHELNESLKRILKTQGFALARSTVEAHGTCGKCI
ncbi:MAG: transcriptional repressor [Alphaproteobacteria bacterium]|nr:transcriptional repressor [Alphaproteobacteria bacterium]